jgi:NAD(P)-dependent dehydrogenase (short-subunit alcohol dehydrogenase family)
MGIAAPDYCVEAIMDVRNRGVLITGASKGLGLALAETLAANGARVAMVARHADTLEAAAARIRRAGGVAHALAFDVGDKLSTYRIAGAAADLVGDIDVLVHNASTLGPVPLKALLETDCEELQDVLEKNLVGPFRLSKAIVGGMLLRKRGVVVHVSSDAAVEAYPTWGAYGVSKAASDHLARVFAAEVPEVRFFSVDPGEMDTDMHAAAMPEADRATLARPNVVADKLTRIIAAAERIPSGARLNAPSWSEP